MNREPINLSDIKSPDFLAEDVLHEMRFNGCNYDENGEWIEHNDRYLAHYEEYIKNAENNILDRTLRQKRSDIRRNQRHGLRIKTRAQDPSARTKGEIT